MNVNDSDLFDKILAIVGVGTNSFEKEKLAAGTKYSLWTRLPPEKIIQIASICNLKSLLYRGYGEKATFGDLVLMAMRYPARGFIFDVEITFFIYKGKRQAPCHIFIVPDSVSIPILRVNVDIIKSFKDFEPDHQLHLDEEGGRWFVHFNHK